MKDISFQSDASGIIAVKPGDTVADHFATLFPGREPRDVVACTINGEINNLHATAACPSRIEPIAAASPAGAQILRRSLCFALAAAAQRGLPAKRPCIGHAIGDGFYWHFTEGPATRNDIAALEQSLRALVAANEAILPGDIAWKDAETVFTRERRPDTVNLLRHFNDPVLPTYRLGDYWDLAYGPLASWTGQLPEWSLSRHGEGFVLDILGPGQKGASTASPMLFTIYHEYKHWGTILEVSDVGQLNDLIYERRIKDFIQVSEALHQQKIADIASRVAERADELKVVLIAGPSSSGKTTFAKKLAIQLTVAGLKPAALSLDDYFVDREKTPRAEDGSYDFEHLGALDIPFLNEQLVQLFDGAEIDLPVFDFKEGRRRFPGRKMRLPKGGVIIMEGIHGLNDELTPLVPADMKYRIYTSALTQLNLDSRNRIPTTDNRLLRRMVRDSRYRGHSAEATLAMWPSVRRGEDRWIFPYQDSANTAFNSALDYEIGVLKPYAEPLLRSVSPASPWYGEARRLVQFLQFFLPVPSEHLPDNSILREFIGGSVFKY
jgi:uridine kinase